MRSSWAIRPHLDKLVGPVKVLLDAYAAGRLNAVYLCYTRFINTMNQEPVVQQLLPLSNEAMAADKGADGRARTWDYIYEPNAQAVIDELLLRYVEALVYQAVAENMASEQSARMVAMKAATDNAGNVIDELKLIYNKTRQAAITKELSRDRGRCGRGLSDPRFTHLKGPEKCLKFKRPARSSSASARWWTSSSRATPCPRSTTRSSSRAPR